MTRSFILVLGIVCVIPLTPVFPFSFEVQHAQARYIHRRHVKHPDRTHVYEPSRVVDREDSWPAFKNMYVIYPYMSGTTLLDSYSGRRPVINAGSCADPTIEWHRATTNYAWTLRE